jgi:hypothetical protein
MCPFFLCFFGELRVPHDIPIRAWRFSSPNRRIPPQVCNKSHPAGVIVFYNRVIK